jgi:transposase
VGPNTAASFLAEMGTVKDFPSYKKLIAFTGLDPSLHQSGKFVGQSKISKRGNRHLRRAIYLMAASVVSQNPFFKSYFFKRKKECLAPQKALFAVAHKLIRVIYAMLSQRTFFREMETI